MELESQILTILILFMFPVIKSESLNISEIEHARNLDAVVQDYAYRAFINPKTGVLYNAVVPNNLTGIQISALRLRRGSLFTRGVPVYKEFKIPIGIFIQPYVERLVLVYQNLGNQSAKYYPLPGYIHLAPVLGLLAYNGSDLLPKPRPELEMQACDKPFSIDFGSVKPAPNGSNPMCVWVDLHGQVNFTNVVSGNRCLAFKQGHFSIVAKSESILHYVSSKRKRGFGSMLWLYISCLVIGFAMGVFVVMTVFMVRGDNRNALNGTGDSGQ